MVIPGTINGKPVVNIGKNAFKDLADLISVVIPDSVTAIDDTAFAGCNDELRILGGADGLAKTFAQNQGMAFLR